MRPAYKMGKHTKHRDSPCPKCGHPIRRNREYVLCPETGRAYHRVCYDQLKKG